MFDKLLKISGTAALYFCACTFLAMLLVGIVLKFKWGIDGAKLNQMVAIAQGYDVLAAKERVRKEVEDEIAKMSYDEVLARRAERLRKEEYEGDRTMQGANLVMAEGATIESRIDRLNRQAAAFEARLDETLKKAQEEGFLQETAMVEKLPAESAKKVLLEIIKRPEGIERVILMLKGMEENARKKILAQFESDEEQAELVKVLQMIGDGEPVKKIVDAARDLPPQ